MSTITLEDGKYTIENNNGILSFSRHGEPWYSGNDVHAGSKLVLALVHRIEELEAAPSAKHVVIPDGATPGTLIKVGPAREGMSHAHGYVVWPTPKPKLELSRDDDLVFTGKQTTLPARDKTRPAEQQGLFGKFTVLRNDGKDARGEKHHDCEYFVLDVSHDPHAKPALAEYAKACRQTHPSLSADLIRRYDLPVVTQTVEDLAANWPAHSAQLLCPIVEPQREITLHLTRRELQLLAIAMVYLGINTQGGVSSPRIMEEIALSAGELLALTESIVGESHRNFPVAARTKGAAK
ncbi:hypothetical protein ACO0LM_12065 [Undibacterium sp. Di26W]|uniref:hypothetical protein n=1 Tax=Undibacterium sp. Di26W TaxID=3413035 RepID=UPI003BF12B87